MAKLTKPEAKAHAQAIEMLVKERLTEDEKEFVFRNWHEGANHINGSAGAFFTPYDMAFDFSFDVGGHRVIDLCAGIGMLSYAVHYRSRFGERTADITCIERNPDYVAVGKKLLPEATWIQADVLDVLDMGLGQFDYAISNPPFGNIKRERNAPRYSGRNFEFHIIDIAAHLANYGVFIVPQGSAGFNYSGRQFYERQKDGKAVKFQELTGLHFDAGVGVDTAFYRDEWKGVSPLCEIVSVDFAEARQMAPAVIAPAISAANDNAPHQPLDLFSFAGAA
ncbi:methyltransferase [Mesorhizobium sp. ESP-6-4]|uniref:methyltransferase n=1 Tax=Mesorhizobium sp. ESP-6-4 TaxID=2876624 RepID=UPI001CCEFB25|nr:methyltransferase [Mesorhizobium sp. ESP-6-4]MBZ9659805.1 methyltransferase [Mesorhizobium sp. ESP-6-4]